MTVPPPLIPLARPLAGDEEIEALARVIASRHLAQGPEVAALEREVSVFFGGKGPEDVVAVSSGGAALLLAMKAAGVPPGSEVVVPAFAFPAAAQAAMWLSAVPVPADVDEETLAVTPATVQAVLGPRTRAVVVVHAFGIPASIEEIVDLAATREIPVIEDAACALGGRTESGRPCGSVGAAGCFSLHPRKAVTAGEGGLVTGHPGVTDRVRLMRDYGRTAPGFGDCFGVPGLNFRLSDLGAAVARVQLRRLAGSIARRRELVGAYAGALAGRDRLRVPRGFLSEGATMQSFVVRAAGAREVVRAMVDRGVQAGVAAHCLTGQSFFAGRFGRMRPCPVAEALAEETMALPLYEEMDYNTIDRVVDALVAATS